MEYQVDTWQGPWSAATNTGGDNFSATTPALQPGVHILYAYAIDAQVATSINGAPEQPIDRLHRRISVPRRAAPPAFTADNPPDSATVGTPYTYTFTATGSPSPTFALATGTLPPGLTLTPTAGSCRGCPTAAGRFTFTVTATTG